MLRRNVLFVRTVDIFFLVISPRGFQYFLKQRKVFRSLMLQKNRKRKQYTVCSKFFTWLGTLIMILSASVRQLHIPTLKSITKAAWRWRNRCGKHLVLRWSLIFPWTASSMSRTDAFVEWKIPVLQYYHLQYAHNVMVCATIYSIFTTPNDYCNALSGHSACFCGNT